MTGLIWNGVLCGPGITMQRTSSCEQELKGTIQRKMRSLSLTNLHKQKTAGELTFSILGSEPQCSTSHDAVSYDRGRSAECPIWGEGTGARKETIKKGEVI